MFPKTIKHKMLLQLILALLLGCTIGTLTGLIPGIHINLIGTFLVTLSFSFFSSTNPVYLAVFVVAMAITHTYLDFIPSIFLGCPDTDTELSVLPGHQLLKKGLAYEAIILTAYGSLAAVFILLIIAIPSILIISKTYDTIKVLIPYILILVSIFLILFEAKGKKFKALFVFVLTGFLGLCVLNLGLKEPLLPLLTGLFGASMLVLSIKTKTKIPKQKIIKKFKTRLSSPLIGAIIAAPICSFLPGLGSGQAAIIGNQITKTTKIKTKIQNPEKDKREFLVLLGATNTLVMGFSFISLYTISKTRTGAAVAIQKILGIPQTNILVLLLSAAFLTGIISFFLTIFLAKFFTKNIQKINYSLLSLLTLIILILIVFLFSGTTPISKFLGLITLIVSTFTGIYCISLGVRRTNLMGCLLIPTILIYLI